MNIQQMALPQQLQLTIKIPKVKMEPQKVNKILFNNNAQNKFLSEYTTPSNKGAKTEEYASNSMSIEKIELSKESSENANSNQLIEKGLNEDMDNGIEKLFFFY